MSPGLEYVRGLTEALRVEVDALLDQHPAAAAEGGGIAAPPPADGTSFQAAWAAYEAACRDKAALANRHAEVAASYESMEAFWADAEAQSTGRSPRTFWDTYEHGRRRRLETILADAHGSEAALLVNAGMSAVEVVLAAVGVQAGGAVVVHERQYFETGELLREVVARRGGHVVEVDARVPGAIAEAAADPAVVAVLVEPVTNSPSCDVAVVEVESLPAHVAVVVDNSLVSHAVSWPRVLEHPRLLVVESGIKFLTALCSAGVVYGTTAEVDAVRTYARSVGQQLQERAFNHLQPGELCRAGERVAVHGANVATFVDALDRGRWAMCRTLQAAAAAAEGVVAKAVADSGAGPLVFLSAGGAEPTLAARHRDIVRRWRALGAAEGIDLRIRAGFGWPITSTRSYESALLNQPDAPKYVRVSVGLEEPEVIRRMAELLDRARVETEADR